MSDSIAESVAVSRCFATRLLLLAGMLWTGLGGLAAVALANPVVALGEFQVNTYTTGAQEEPRVSHDPDGGFVVVWHGGGDQDGDGYGVFARRYAANGLPIGSEFHRSTPTRLTTRSCRPCLTIPAGASSWSGRAGGMEAASASSASATTPAQPRSAASSRSTPTRQKDSGARCCLTIPAGASSWSGTARGRTEIILWHLRPALRSERERGRQRVPGQHVHDLCARACRRVSRSERRLRRGLV